MWLINRFWFCEHKLHAVIITELSTHVETKSITPIKSGVFIMMYDIYISLQFIALD